MANRAWSIACAALLALYVSERSAKACDAPIGPTPEQLVRAADLIVTATAVEFVRESLEPVLLFRVTAVIKGTAPSEPLVIRGYLDAKDDFNDSAGVPRTFVRPGGRHGECYARNYREGATYLLILKRQEGRFTPYWTPLKPTNEQVKPDADEWVEWVRDYVRAVP